MDLKNPTRTESLLANIAGYTGVPVPDMKNATRSERLLKEILDNGGGGGGGDVTKEYVDNAIANAVADIDDDISALSGTVADKVDKVNGKSLSTNDYTDADKALVQNSPITVTATGTEITASTAQGNINALTIYGKSEVVDGAITSTGEGWATVDLGTLTWTYDSEFYSNSVTAIKVPELNAKTILCYKYNAVPTSATTSQLVNKDIMLGRNQRIYIKDTDYIDATAFKNSLDDVLLCYQLADPTQGNAIAVKTDDGTGINGTMAVFETGTPLRGIPDTDVRDVMEWDGSSGEITKFCAVENLGTRNWNIANEADHTFYIGLPGVNQQSDTVITNLADYTQVYSLDELAATDKSFLRRIGTTIILFRNTAYTEIADFKTSMSGKTIVYELATPTTTPLTSTENASIAGLRTFTPQTYAQNNAGAVMTIEAYAGTANGKAVNELKQDVQSEISALKITQSDTLTLTVNGWSSNQQTVTYAHDTSKRNVIDVDPASVEEWASCGILATAETASGITFTCKTVPENALNFKVTSMGV